MHRVVLILALLPATSLCLFAEESHSNPKEIPVTRPQLKQALEKLKQQQARLPLPPPSDQERRAPRTTLPDLSGEILNSARLRNLYLHNDLFGSRGKDPRQQQRKKDPNMSLDPTFSIELVWIASRANNCHYCLGHQEVKLRALGENEPRLAAIDCDWSQFSPAERSAFAFARKLTLRPDSLTDEDVQSVLAHYKPLHVLEMAMVISRYNMANRWNSSLGIPQEEYRVLMTDTPEEFAETKSIIAPVKIEGRRPLESREATLGKLDEARRRKARLPLVDEATAAQVAGDRSSERPAHWVRLLANFPIEGKGLIDHYRLSVEKGSLSLELKAQIAWAAAREDRAWYAIDLALRRLKSLGYSEDRAFALDSSGPHPLDGVGQALAFTRKLTSTPQAIVDGDVEALRRHFRDTEVAEIIYQGSRAAFFNRVTEASGLPLDP